MDDWENAVEKFVDKWTEDVEGILVCGSYVTGSPSKRSDIDLHIVMPSAADWRMRGAEVIDGYLVEYFVNPPRQIRAYFKEDHESNRKHTAHQFMTGRIIKDTKGVMVKLQAEAQEWMEKEYPELDQVAVELNKYALWDQLDNLQDVYVSGSKSFTYTYWSSLKSAFVFYSKYLGHDIIPVHTISEQLNDPTVQTKYSIAEYPDQAFKEMMNRAITAQTTEQMHDNFKEIVEHIHRKTGGFSLDGWNVRTPLSEGI